MSSRSRRGRRWPWWGPTGAGKTALVSLRLYDPAAGEIVLDGTDLRGWDLEDLRRQVAVVFAGLRRCS